MWVSSKLPQSKGFNAVAVSPDGLRVAGGSDDFNIYLWDLDSGSLQSELSGHGAWVYGLAWSPDSASCLGQSRSG